MEGQQLSSSGAEKHVLVVGGAGYVGNAMTRRMLEAGWNVRVLDQLLFDHGSAMAPLLEHPRFSFVHGDMRDRSAVDAALNGITDVALLAGLVGDPITKTYPELSNEINLGGCATVLEALAESDIERFVFTSTCSNYGLRTSDDPATEESELAPLSLYAEHKVEMEKRILAAAPEADYTSTVLRISTAYALRPDDLRVHQDARRGRGARGLRRRHLAPLLPRLRHLQGRHDRSRGRSRARCR
jgi:nucleoside-diphosphate-sugar epimerase